MKEILHELVLEYRPEDLRSWRSGRRPPWLDGEVPAHVRSHPSCHFGEYYTLARYRGNGWRGHRLCVLAGAAAEGAEREEAYADMLDCFGADRLDALAEERRACGMRDAIGGAALFLLRPTGEHLFLEVKKGRERVGDAHLHGLALIRRILSAEVGIVYLKQHGTWYEPRQYELDLSQGRGKQLRRESEPSALAAAWFPCR